MKNRVWNHIDFGRSFLKDFGANLPPFWASSWGPKSASHWVRVQNQCKRFPRGSKSVPRASQEGPRASQERPKSTPRAAESLPRASKTRSSDAQDSSRSAQKQPGLENQGGALQKHRKIEKKSIKHGRKYRFITQKWPKVANMALRSTKAKQMILEGNSHYPWHPP